MYFTPPLFFHLSTKPLPFCAVNDLLYRLVYGTKLTLWDGIYLYWPVDNYLRL